jgi:hypothetical protein
MTSFFLRRLRCNVSVRSGYFRRNLQVPRQEFIDPVDGMIGDAGKDIP